MARNIIGKMVTITAKDSIHCGDWGIVQYKDEDGYYGVAMFGDEHFCPIFNRKEFKICKED